MDGYKLQFNIIPGEWMPLLFENGEGSSVHLWDGIASNIASITGAPLIRYNRQGIGKSSVNPNKKGIESEIIGLENALKKLGYNKEFFLVASSTGGFFTTVFASKNPDKTKGIVFFDKSLPCYFTEDEVAKSANPITLSDMVRAAKENPIPLTIPLIDVVAEKTIKLSPLWGECHLKLEEKASNRIGIIAEECSHFIFKDNRGLAINVCS
jgi:pimeloyl-ACP methyl ester carboxylesterase